MKKSTCSSGARPARISQSQGNDWDLKVSEACSLSTLYDCVLSLESAGLCGKMSPLFVSLLCGWNVPVPESGWRKCGIVTPAPGGFGVAWRVLDSQFTRVEQFPRAIPQRRKRLFLSGNIPPRYYLTVKCAEGILRRAARRGKTLPPVLKEALLRQTGGTVPRRRAH